MVSAETVTNGKYSQDKLPIDSAGRFQRQAAVFRNFISPDPSAEFPAEKDRYVLYVNFGCPWAHRTLITRALKGLEDVIQLVVLDPQLSDEGWHFTGQNGSAEKDPLYGFTKIRQFYFKADPNYSGRFTVPMLWDKKKETVVNNESSELIRMFYESFDAFLPEERREEKRPNGGLFPAHLRGEIEAMNEWVLPTINNGVYKTGLSATQEAYEEAVYPIFESLDRLEAHLAEPEHQPFLFGQHITEADIRLFTTLIRFDGAYYNLFKCNLKMIRHDYPRLYKWLRTLYWDNSPETNFGAFKNTTYFDLFKRGYAMNGKFKVVPVGPKPDIHGLDEAVAA